MWRHLAKRILPPTGGMHPDTKYLAVHKDVSTAYYLDQDGNILESFTWESSFPSWVADNPWWKEVQPVDPWMEVDEEL